jgi:hypothetical protein
MKRVIGCILLLFGISGVASVIGEWGAAETEYGRTALFLEAVFVVLLLLWGISLVRSRPKPRAGGKPEGDDRPSG